jgi:hypothetical protein
MKKRPDTVVCPTLSAGCAGTVVRLKNKKIAFYIAQPHHSKYLFPVSEAVRKEGAEIFFFTTSELYPFEGELLKKGYKYKFVSDYADEETIQQIRRVSNKFYDEWIQLIFHWDGIRHWPLCTQDRLFMSRIEEYICLERMARIEKPDMFVALHEINPWGKEIGHVAAKYGIPYVTLQEGDYYADILNFCVHTEYSTVNLLWGESTVQHLEKFRCSPDKMVIVGNMYLDEVINKYSTSSMRKTIRDELGVKQGKKVLAFLLGFDWALINRKEIWQALCHGLVEDELVCIFKWHTLVPVVEFKKIEALIKEIMPAAIVLYTYDPYKILSIANYCVVLGRSTIALEAVAWKKPLLEVQSLQAEGHGYGGDTYYSTLGIAQLASPLGNWEKLFSTLKKGIPAGMQENVDKYVRRAFYKLDGKAIERAASVISFILDVKGKKVKGREAGPTPLTDRSGTRGRVSFIVPSGNDPEVLLSSLTSLSEGVALPDWETIIVVNDGAIKHLLAGISGDVKVVDASTSLTGQGDNLSQLFNKGAEASSGEFLVFMIPGIVYLKGEGLIEAMRDGAAGMPIKNADMTPYCLGIGFNFNSTPFFIKEEVAQNASRDAVGGGLIGINREAFITVGGFDEGIANHLIEADICLAAKDNGYSVSYLPDCLGVVYKNEAAGYWQEAKGNDYDNGWKRRIRFFAKWCGKLPKDDDIIKFLGDWMKV